MTSADPLVAIADGLYGLPPEQFTAARDAAAKGTGDRAVAGRIRKLKRPAIAAWAVNLLVRREVEQVEQALALGASLRQAAETMDADQLRELTRQRRRLTAALATTARGLARETGVRLTDATTEQVEGVLTAGMLDPGAAALVRTGLLLKAFTVNGVDEVDPAALLAVPEAVGVRATPVETASAPALRVVPESDQLRRERAEEAVRAAAAVLAAAEQECRDAEAGLARWTARRLQVHDELDEARRRIADLEAEADRVDVEVEDAEVVQADATEALADARAAHGKAQAHLDRL